ncbi:prepilin-type N-terminal cleavage/methylation domain-containing protein [bacterium]|nr:prepilin-type N-terminal cleavage/methylation domain-containing protein [bacterium]MBU1935817.1 prepilin-type N-terminal cleavage/methylation domain-containing protein [bacterium]
MKRRRKERGMTLLEVLLATFVLVVGFLIIITSFVAMARANRYSEKQDVAVQLASRVMEDVRNQRFADIQSDEGNYYEYYDFPDFRHRTDVVTVGQVKEVIVEIFFDNDRKRVRLVSYCANM